LPANIAAPASDHRDLTYCTPQPGAPQRMDLYQPEAKTGLAPVVIYIHGGGWTSGDKNDPEGMAFLRTLRQLGYVVVSINYRLAPEYRFPAQIEDVKCAVRHLRANAEAYGLDPQRIGVIGASAGGHLAALLGTSDESAGFDVGQHLDQSSRVQAVVDLFAPVDLVRMMATSRAVIGEGVFGVSTMEPEKIRPYSPITYITPDDPPFLILHGDRDTVVPLEQSQILHEALVAAAVPSELVIVRNAEHSFNPAQMREIQPSPVELIEKVVEFFERNLPATTP
jgi:acetyl esterase/lipase